MVLLPRQARDKHIGESLICKNNTSTVYARRLRLLLLLRQPRGEDTKKETTTFFRT